jgi:putative addiction module component (TIGR02574 family)
MSPLENVVRQALSLELRDRARLTERLLGSLDGLSEAEIEQLWLDEAERRLEAYRGGRSEGIPAEDVLREAEDLAR